MSSLINSKYEGMSTLVQFWNTPLEWLALRGSQSTTPYRLNNGKFGRHYRSEGVFRNFTYGQTDRKNFSTSFYSVVCKHWLRGLCKKGDDCEFLHEYDMAKMPECYFFSKFGRCENRDCQYLHIDPNSKVKECPWYARGFCKHGPNCKSRNGFIKMKWVLGTNTMYIDFQISQVK